MPLRFLVFGDVVGRPGRVAVTTALAELKQEHAADAVIVNIENSAHGFGISPGVMEDIVAWQADAYTTGDHAWDKRAGYTYLDDPKLPIVRPANYPEGVPGRGYVVFTCGAYRVAVINLQGQVFMKNHPLNPFHALTDLLQHEAIRTAQVRLVDFHAEATSEKRALGWHFDGQVSAIWGTHTHIPTADAQVLPQGTGYITDIGMNGNYESVIGVDREGPLKGFLTQVSQPYTVAHEGSLEIGAVLIEVDPTTGATTHIAHIRKILNA